MEVKRLVTAHGPDGNPTFASIGPAPRANWSRYHPGAGITVVWADPAGATIPNTGQDITETLPSLIPPVGATSLLFVQFPAQTGVTDPNFDPVAAQEEFVRLNPGIAELMDPQSPGMHATDTIDYVIVLEGEICVILEGGREELLRQHDVIIQNGTRHAWRNRSTRPAKLACFSVGARRR
jgi:mannose-6-phosphate isomerase-like protein (cupin superfamily)